MSPECIRGANPRVLSETAVLLTSVSREYFVAYALKFGIILLVILRHHPHHPRLGLFEIVSSIDNAVVNAEILSTMSPKGRSLFLTWDFLGAVSNHPRIAPWLIILDRLAGTRSLAAFIASFPEIPALKERLSKQPRYSLPEAAHSSSFFFQLAFSGREEIRPAHEKFFARKGIWFLRLPQLSSLFWFGFGGKISFLVAFGTVIGEVCFYHSRIQT